MQQAQAAKGPIRIAPGVWRKTYGDDQRLWREALLGWVVRALGIPPLQPVPRPVSAAARSDLEANRIAALAALGVLVPTIVGRGPTHLDLQDLGPTLSILIKKEPLAERRAILLEAGFAALSELHRRGGVLSEAFARNMTRDQDGRIGFIDLETEPLTVMTADQSRARDLIFFVYSTARFVPCNDARYVAGLSQAFAALPVATRTAVTQVVRKLQGLRGPAGIVGRAGRSLRHALVALHAVVDAGPAGRGRPSEV